MHKGQRVRYLRINTLDQKTERQLDGTRLDKVFADKTSGKDTKRPQLTARIRAGGRHAACAQHG
jgi:DNA invertase Pin-like site-specific DNA recombinase